MVRYLSTQYVRKLDPLLPSPSRPISPVLALASLLPPVRDVSLLYKIRSSGNDTALLMWCTEENGR